MIASLLVAQAVLPLTLCEAVDHLGDVPANWPCEQILSARYPSAAASERRTAVCVVEFEYTRDGVTAPCARCATSSGGPQEFVDASIETLRMGVSDRLNEGRRYSFALTYAGGDEGWPAPPSEDALVSHACLRPTDELPKVHRDAESLLREPPTQRN